MLQRSLATLRSNTCYPAFRAFVVFTAFGGYAICALAAVSSLITGDGLAVMMMIASALVGAVLVRVGLEAALMLADIADASIAAAFAEGRVRVDSDSQADATTFAGQDEFVGGERPE